MRILPKAIEQEKWGNWSKRLLNLHCLTAHLPAQREGPCRCAGILAYKSEKRGGRV
jgi:hypothetical protein